MPEHPNAAAFRQAVADMLQGDLDRFRDLLAADVMWHEAGSAQPLRGRESVMRIFEGLVSSGLEFDDDVQVVLADDEHLAAFILARIRRGDAEVTYPVVEFARLHEGRMVERWAFMDAVPADVAAFFSD